MLSSAGYDTIQRPSGGDLAEDARMTDWSQYHDVERDAATLSGAWRLKGTRIRPDDVLGNHPDLSIEEIVEQYPALTPERVSEVIAFAEREAHAHSPG